MPVPDLLPLLAVVALVTLPWIFVGIWSSKGGVRELAGMLASLVFGLLIGVVSWAIAFYVARWWRRRNGELPREPLPNVIWGPTNQREEPGDSAGGAS